MKTIIVGAGISGLATAHALLKLQPDLELQVLESAERTGGKVWTVKTEEGFLCEAGVNAFLDSKPKTLELAATLGLNPVRSFDASRHRYVYSQGELHELPASPPAFLSSRLLSVPGRLRVLLDALLPRSTEPDETLAQFAIRRLGREAFEKLIDPMASGVYAGDPARLSLKSCFPRIHEVETEYRSLILGLIQLQMQTRRQKAKGADTPSPSAGPAGALTSFGEGMSELTDSLAKTLGKRLLLSQAVTGISREGKQYVVHLAQGESKSAQRLILAAPAHAQADMLKTFAPNISALLNQIPYPPLAVCCFGYRKDKIKHHLNGFGFLVPARERRKILGTLWDVSIFPHRAPEGYVLLRSMVGGMRQTGLVQLPDAKLIDLVKRELTATMGVDTSPDFVRIYRHAKSIPQYVVGHAQRQASITRLLQKYPGLILTGNAYNGVSLNDCVANAYRVAQQCVVTG